MTRTTRCAATSAVLLVLGGCRAADISTLDLSEVSAEHLLSVPHYCEGVVFDHEGNGYISEGETVWRFSQDSGGAWQSRPFAERDGPNGHKVLADGTHLVCDAKQHAVRRLSADGEELDPASTECEGEPLRGPNDLSLDTPNGGFYFTDPGGSDDKKLVGTVHYVDAAGKTHLIDKRLAFPNGIVLTPNGKRLLVAESKKNRILVYGVHGPGQVGPRNVFAELPAKDAARGQIDNQPDGMCLDARGNLYVAHYGMREVQVLNTQGRLVARLPGGNLTTSNVAFGGPDMNELFVTGAIGNSDTTEGRLFRLRLGVEGLVILPERDG